VNVEYTVCVAHVRYIVIARAVLHVQYANRTFAVHTVHELCKCTTCTCTVLVHVDDFYVTYVGVCTVNVFMGSKYFVHVQFLFNIDTVFTCQAAHYMSMFSKCTVRVQYGVHVCMCSTCTVHVQCQLDSWQILPAASQCP
jgi:hypothetical protein